MSVSLLCCADGGDESLVVQLYIDDVTADYMVSFYSSRNHMLSSLDRNKLNHRIKIFLPIFRIHSVAKEYPGFCGG